MAQPILARQPRRAVSVLRRFRSPDLQVDTPQPTNKDVYIHDTPSATFYVSQYSGFGMDDITVTKHVRTAITSVVDLAKALPFASEDPAFAEWGFDLPCFIGQSLASQTTRPSACGVTNSRC